MTRVRWFISSSVGSSSSMVLTTSFSLMRLSLRSSPTLMSSSTATGTSTSAYRTSCSPCSIFLAMVTSPSRSSSGTAPIFAQVHTDRVRAAGGKVGGVFVVHQFKAFFGLLSVRFSRGDGDFLAVLFQIHNGDFELIEDPDDLLELLGVYSFPAGQPCSLPRT